MIFSDVLGEKWTSALLDQSLAGEAGCLQAEDCCSFQGLFVVGPSGPFAVVPHDLVEGSYLLCRFGHDFDLAVADDALIIHAEFAREVAGFQLMPVIHLKAGSRIAPDDIELTAFNGAVKKQCEAGVIPAIAKIQGYNIGLPVIGQAESADVAVVQDVLQFLAAGDFTIAFTHVR